jgi:hypothetical protein
MGGKRYAYSLLVGKQKERDGLENKMDLGEIGWGGVDWLGLAQVRDKWRTLVNEVMNPRGPINCWETID